MNNKYWLNWTLNCAFGELMGIGIAGAIAFGVNTLLGEPEQLGMKLIVLFCMVIAGIIEGAFLGYFQWRVLVKKFPKIPMREWLFYTILIGALGWFLGMLPSLFFAPSSTGDQESMDFSNPLIFAFLSISMGLVLGALFGLFQWISLREYANHAYLWIVANGFGWGMGIGWIFLFASIPDEHSSLAFNILMGATGGILAGLSVGAITGYYLLQLEEKIEIQEQTY